MKMTVRTQPAKWRKWTEKTMVNMIKINMEMKVRSSTARKTMANMVTSSKWTMENMMKTMMGWKVTRTIQISNSNQ